jgi:S-adenosyl methyltransferase
VTSEGSSRTDEGESPTFDVSVAHQARIYDYWLGGKDNYAADRKAAEAAVAAYPGVATGARANRQFLARVVRHLAGEAGVRQFLDIGTGIPSANNTHELVIGAVPAGSYLALSHPASDIDPEKIADATARLNQLSHQHFTLRDHAGVTRFFDGLELLEPGVVRVEDWRRDRPLGSVDLSAVWGGVARKR